MSWLNLFFLVLLVQCVVCIEQEKVNVQQDATSCDFSNHYLEEPLGLCILCHGEQGLCILSETSAKVFLKKQCGIWKEKNHCTDLFKQPASTTANALVDNSTLTTKSSGTVNPTVATFVITFANAMATAPVTPGKPPPKNGTNLANDTLSSWASVDTKSVNMLPTWIMGLIVLFGVSSIVLVHHRFSKHRRQSERPNDMEMGMTSPRQEPYLPDIDSIGHVTPQPPYLTDSRRSSQSALIPSAPPPMTPVAASPAQPSPMLYASSMQLYPLPNDHSLLQHRVCRPLHQAVPSEPKEREQLIGAVPIDDADAVRLPEVPDPAGGALFNVQVSTV